MPRPVHRTSGRGMAHKQRSHALAWAGAGVRRMCDAVTLRSSFTAATVLLLLAISDAMVGSYVGSWGELSRYLWDGQAVMSPISQTHPAAFWWPPLEWAAGLMQDLVLGLPTATLPRLMILTVYGLYFKLSLEPTVEAHAVEASRSMGLVHLRNQSQRQSSTHADNLTGWLVFISAANILFYLSFWLGKYEVVAQSWMDLAAMQLPAAFCASIWLTKGHANVNSMHLGTRLIQQLWPRHGSQPNVTPNNIRREGLSLHKVPFVCWYYSRVGHLHLACIGVMTSLFLVGLRLYSIRFSYYNNLSGSAQGLPMFVFGASILLLRRLCIGQTEANVRSAARLHHVTVCGWGCLGLLEDIRGCLGLAAQKLAYTSPMPSSRPSSPVSRQLCTASPGTSILPLLIWFLLMAFTMGVYHGSHLQSGRPLKLMTLVIASSMWFLINAEMCLWSTLAAMGSIVTLCLGMKAAELRVRYEYAVFERLCVPKPAAPPADEDGRVGGGDGSTSNISPRWAVAAVGCAAIPIAASSVAAPAFFYESQQSTSITAVLMAGLHHHSVPVLPIMAMACIGIIAHSRKHNSTGSFGPLMMSALVIVAVISVALVLVLPTYVGMPIAGTNTCILAIELFGSPASTGTPAGAGTGPDAMAEGLQHGYAGMHGAVAGGSTRKRSLVTHTTLLYGLMHRGLCIFLLLRQVALSIVVASAYIVDCPSFDYGPSSFFVFSGPVYFAVRNIVSFYRSCWSAQVSAVETVLAVGRQYGQSVEDETNRIMSILIIASATIVPASSDGTIRMLSECRTAAEFRPSLLFLSYFMLTLCMYFQGAETTDPSKLKIHMFHQCFKATVFYGLFLLVFMVGSPFCILMACSSGYLTGFMRFRSRGTSSIPDIDEWFGSYQSEGYSPDDANAYATPECTVCLSQPPTHLCIPCGHKCLCKDCSDQLMAHAQQQRNPNQCPVCRHDVVGCFRVYDT